jgi:hypothetical protein
VNRRHTVRAICAEGTTAVGRLLELSHLAEVVGRARVVAPTGEGVVMAVVCIPWVGAEWRPVVGGAALLVHFGASSEIAHYRPLTR